MIFCVKLKQNCYFQWQIQDFQGRGANALGEGINILFGKNFAENYMKMEEIVPAGYIPRAPWIRQWLLQVE